MVCERIVEMKTLTLITTDNAAYFLYSMRDVKGQRVVNMVQNIVKQD